MKPLSVPQIPTLTDPVKVGCFKVWGPNSNLAEMGTTHLISIQVAPAFIESGYGPGTVLQAEP